MLRSLGAHKFWQLANLAMLLLCLVLAVLYYSGGSSRALKAQANGQRLVFDLATGGVLGKILMTEDASQTPESVDAEGLPQRGADMPATPPRPQTLPEEPVIDRALPGDFSQKEPTETVIRRDALIAQQAEEPAGQGEEPSAASAQAPGDKAISASAGKPLRAAPQPELVEKTPEGILPKIGADGSRPWKVYSKLDDYVRPANKPLVAIIITGLGLGRLSTEAALDLPENFTLSFSPYARKARMWAEHARNIGHEVMLDLPMQTVDYPATDPGPYGLLNVKPVQDNRERLRWLMQRFPGYIGFTAPADADAPDAVMLSAMVDIGGRGLLFVDVDGDAADFLDTKKADLGLIDLTASHQLDSSLIGESIDKSLAEVEKIARRQGYALAVARPYPVTLKRLQAWHESLKDKSIALAPLSVIAQARE
jgi:hypothetical protein